VFNRIKNKIKYYYYYFIIKNSDLFDKKYYISKYLKDDNKNPIQHYLETGAKEGLKPSKKFCPISYLESNPDVKLVGVNPLVHYLRFGKKEGRTWLLSDVKNNLLLNQCDYYLIEEPGYKYLEGIISKLKSIVKDEKQYKPSWVPNKVLIIGDMGLPQCNKYRILQKVEILSSLGLSTYISNYNDVIRSVNYIFDCSTIIFFRLANSKIMSLYLELAELVGAEVLYDIDDPLFDKDGCFSNKNLDTLTKEEKSSALNSVKYYKQAILKFNKIFVSTPGLKQLAHENGAKNVLIWRNAIDKQTLQAAKYALKNRREHDGIIRVFYGSGSRAHDKDFEIVEDVLINLLKDMPQIHLAITGYTKLTNKLSKFENRLRVLPYSCSEVYLTEIASSDLTIIPLLQNRFNYAKSAIRYMESSIVHVPVIASKTGDFINIIKDGVNGFLAGNEEEWDSKLRALINSEELRANLANNANAYVSTNLTTENIADNIRHMFVIN